MLAMEPTDKPAERPPSSGVMLRGEGRVSIGRRSPSVLVCRVVGSIDAPHVEWLLRELDRHVADGVREVFVDADHLLSCAPSLDQIFGPWSQRHRDDLQCLHVLGGTTKLDAQLSVLAPMLGDRLVCHTQADHFAATMNDHIR